METKRLILTMAMALVIIFGWQYIMFEIYGPPRPPQAATPTTSPTTMTAATGPSTRMAATTESGAVMTAGPATTAPAAGGVAPTLAPKSNGNAPTVVTLGADAQYPVLLKVRTTGASIDQAILKYALSGQPLKGPDEKGPYSFQLPYSVDDPDTYSMATRTLVINGTPVDVAGAVWEVAEQTDHSVRLSLEIQDKNKPMLRVWRSYGLKPKSAPGLGYDLEVSDSYENLTARPLTVKAIMNGPTTPPPEIEGGGHGDVQVIAGYNDDGEVVANNHLEGSFTEKKPSVDLTVSEKKQPLLWFGTASVYFDAIYRPHPLQGKSPTPRYISNVTATGLNLDAEATERDVRITWETEPQTLAPNKKLALSGSLFLGPKQRSLLNSAYYAQFPRSYGTTLVIESGMCGICTFQWLISVLFSILWFFHLIFRDWGVAIIALVVVVRVLLHPITKRSQVSMMKMGKMGPEVERLKKKHGENKDELNKAMMELYKEQGFTPILGCLPMFLQMPIWIALWQALQSTFELRQAPFFYGLTWIHDLAKPDELIKFAHPVPLFFFGWHLYAVNLLPLLMIIVTFMNQKYMPQPAATTPEQKQQQNMMKWMSMVFPLMFYGFPSGLNLYYVTSMGLGIIESKRIREHIQRKEEEEKAGKVIVDAPKSMKKRRGDDEGPLGAKRKGPKPPPKRGLAKIFADIQAKAEAVRKQADRGRGGK